MPQKKHHQNKLKQKNKHKNIFSLLLLILVTTFSLLTLILASLPNNLRRAKADSPYGFLDNANCDTINGWVWDNDAPNQAVEVHIYDGAADKGGKFLTAIKANQYRADVASLVSKDNGLHGFSWNTPTSFKTDRLVHPIYAYAINVVGTVGANKTLYNSGQVIDCRPGNATIKTTALGAPLNIQTTARVAGSIHSLNWKGKEFVNSDDHGRQIQYAWTLDGKGECWNPTEAGSRTDGSGPITQSYLETISTTTNSIKTKVKPAFWMQPNETQGFCANGASRAINQTKTSTSILEKEVTAGIGGLDNVIAMKAKITSGETANSMTVEAPTGYLTSEFSQFYRYNPLKKQLVTLNTTGTSIYDSTFASQDPTPVVLSTPDQQYAMGVYTTNKGAIYGLNKYPDKAKTNKWTIMFNRQNVTTGSSQDYTTYLVVGNLGQVQDTMNKLHQQFPTEMRFVEGYLDIANCQNISGWSWDPKSINQSIDVHLYDGEAGLGGKFLAVVKANQNRPDVAVWVSKDNGLHGFGLITPAILKDGKEHKIYAYGIDPTSNGFNVKLIGSSKSIICGQ